MTTLIVVKLWQQRDDQGRVTPEGYDDATVESSLGEHHFQMKSRRPSAGLFPVTQLRKDLRSVALAWDKRRTAGLGLTTTLVLERSVETIELTEFDFKSQPRNETLETHIYQSWHGDPRDAEAFADTVQVKTCLTPKDEAIKLLTDGLSLPPALSEIIFAAICTEIGQLADQNADRKLSERASLTIHGVDVIIESVLAVVDIDRLEEATYLGVLSSVDWAHLNATGSVFYHNYPTPGLVVDRPSLTSRITDVAVQSKLAAVSGPSGSGKSEAIWAAAREMRNEYRWQELHTLMPVGKQGRDAIALIVARIESLRPSRYAPIGLLIDDAGQHDPGLIEKLLRRLSAVKDVAVILSVREEDRPLIPLLSAITTIVPTLNDEFAEAIWREYRKQELTDWSGWREPAEASGRLLLEYVTILTEGQGLDAIVATQIQARENDASRHLELDILRLVAVANQYGLPLRASAVRDSLGVGQSEFTAATRRLIAEHLVLQDDTTSFRPLHELRSAAIAKAINIFGQSEAEQMVLPLLDVQEISRFIRRCLEAGSTVAPLARTAAQRIRSDGRIETLVAVISGFRFDALHSRAREWKRVLDDAGVDSGLAVSAFSMSRTPPTHDLDHLWKSEVVVSVKKLRTMPTDPDLQAVWRELDGKLVSQLLAEAASSDSPEALLRALTVLRGFDVSSLHAAARLAGARIPEWDLREAADVVEAFRLVAPALAVMAMEAAGGEQAAFNRLVVECSWLVHLEREGDAAVGKWVFFDEAIQPDANGSVVEICRLALAFAPSANIARIQAVDTRGSKAMVGQYPIADKEIPRRNLPHRLEVAENRAQARALARLYGKGSVTDKVAAEAEGLRIVQSLSQSVASAFLRGIPLPAEAQRQVGTLYKALEAMMAPAAEGFQDELPGALGEYPSDGDAVLVIRSFLQTVVPDLASASLKQRNPQRAAANLKDAVAKMHRLTKVNSYHFLTSPPDLFDLLDRLQALQIVAAAGAYNSEDLLAKMRASFGGVNLDDPVRSAAKRAIGQAEILLASEARHLEIALNHGGLEARVVPLATQVDSLAWPHADLLAVIEQGTLSDYFLTINSHADLVRSSRKYPLRRIWLAKKEAQGVLRPSVVQVAYEGILPLGSRTDLDSFDIFAPESISTQYRDMIESAYRVASIAAVISIRGTRSIPNEEGEALEHGIKTFRTSLEVLRNSLGSLERTQYAQALADLADLVEASLEDDVAALTMIDEAGFSGWGAAQIKSLDALDPKHAAVAGSAAEYVYSWIVTTAQVEDDFSAAASL